MTGKVNLSARMKAVADLVTVGNSACDVGCDHGYVSIYLVQERKAPKVVAMDVNAGPLQRAKEHVAQADLSRYIALRLSDGLTGYQQGEAQSLVIAGMGGRLMKKILEKDLGKTESFQEMILQPQSEIKMFREFLRNMGYSIVEEDMILEEDKFYPIIKAVAGTYQGENPQLEDRFGPILLKKKHPVLALFLQREWESSLNIKRELEKSGMGEKAKERLFCLEAEMDYLYQAAKVCGCENKLTDRK